MPFTVQQLIEGRQKPVTVPPDVSAQRALELMIRHDFSQLPVVERDEKLLGMVTSDSILRALKNLGVTLNELRVDHALVKLGKKDWFGADDDLFALLDNLRDTYAVLIVDGENRLTGIVSSYDATEYFRRRAEDIMLVEDIEGTLKESILNAFNNSTGEIDQAALDEAKKEITESPKEIKGRFENALRHYLKLQGVSDQNPNKEWLKEAFSKHLDDKVPPKPFEKLTLNDYIELFLHKKCWSHYSSVFNLEAKVIRELLKNVREIRNDLAHFRDQIYPEQRERLRYCADLLARCQSAISEVSPIDVTEPIGEKTVVAGDADTSSTTSTSDAEEIFSVDEALLPDDSRYTPLSLQLKNQLPGQDKLPLTFEQIEKINGSKLPKLARQHPSWWSNDPITHPQSQQWLDVGWRVLSKDLTEEKVIFTRNKQQEKAHIDFFSILLTELQKSDQFTVRHPSQDGRHLVSVAGLPEGGLPVATLAFSFTLYGKFRVELYLDKSGKEQNKRIYDALFTRKKEIETVLGESLTWERMDDKPASRIALYHAGAITDSKDKQTELQKWAVNAMVGLQKVMNEKINEVLDEIVNTQS
jgi:CBS domain-containing protein